MRKPNRLPNYTVDTEHAPSVIRLEDNEKIYFGDGDDGYIYWDGTNLYVRTATGKIILWPGGSFVQLLKAIKYAGTNPFNIYGGDTSGDDMNLYANSVDTKSRIQLSGNAGLDAWSASDVNFNLGDAAGAKVFKLKDSGGATQFQVNSDGAIEAYGALTYKGTNPFTIYGGDTTGDDFKLRANSVDAKPYVDLYGNLSIEFVSAYHVLASLPSTTDSHWFAVLNSTPAFCLQVKGDKSVTAYGTLNFTDANTQIWEDGSSNLSFKDANAGTKTLTELTADTQPTKEFFIPVCWGNGAQGVTGLHHRWRCAGDSGQAAYVEFAVPLDFTAIIRAEIKIITLGVGTNYSIQAEYGAQGEQYNTHAGGAGPIVPISIQNAILGCDISAILGSLAAGDYVGCEISDSGAGTGTDFDVLGVHFIYA